MANFTRDWVRDFTFSLGVLVPDSTGMSSRKLLYWAQPDLMQKSRARKCLIEYTSKISNAIQASK